MPALDQHDHIPRAGGPVKDPAEKVKQKHLAEIAIAVGIVGTILAWLTFRKSKSSGGGSYTYPSTSGNGNVAGADYSQMASLLSQGLSSIDLGLAGLSQQISGLGGGGGAGAPQTPITPTAPIPTAPTPAPTPTAPAPAPVAAPYVATPTAPSVVEQPIAAPAPPPALAPVVAAIPPQSAPSGVSAPDYLAGAAPTQVGVQPPATISDPNWAVPIANPIVGDTSSVVVGETGGSSFVYGGSQTQADMLTAQLGAPSAPVPYTIELQPGAALPAPTGQPQSYSSGGSSFTYG